MRFCILVLIVGLFSQTKLFAETTPPRTYMGAGLIGRLQPNHRPDGVDFLPRPYFVYSMTSPGSFPTSLRLIAGGIFNRADLTYQPHRDWELSGGLGTLFYVGGDRPKIDKDNFNNTLDFRSSDVSSSLGVHRWFQIGGTRFHASALYQLQFSWSFQRKDNFHIIPPKTFLQHGPIARFGVNNTLRNQRIDRGWAPQAFFSFQRREGWLTERVADQYQLGPRKWIEAGGALQGIHDFGSQVSSVFEVSGQWISEGDRLNSRPGRNLNGNHQRRFITDIRADRLIKSSGGLMFFVDSRRQFAIKPYVVGYAFRELTPFFKRNRLGFGPVVEVLGQSFGRFEWSFYAAGLYGLRDNPTLTHEAGFELSYRISP